MTKHLPDGLFLNYNPLLYMLLSEKGNVLAIDAQIDELANYIGK